MQMEAQQAQIEAARAQQDMYEAQARMLREQQYAQYAYSQANAATLHNKAKLENDFKAEINSRLEKQSKELFRLESNGTIPDAFVVREKELEFSKYIFKNYLLGKDGKIYPLNWYQLADIVDYIANHTKTDTGFRVVLWGLFGATIPNEHTPIMTRFVDNKNPGLQDRYLNDGYDQEQIHHYLAGVTGDFDDSHKRNNWFFTGLNELQELSQKGRWNQGDWLLFQHTQSHRDDFVKGNLKNIGRYTVAANMRKILKPLETKK